MANHLNSFGITMYEVLFEIRPYSYDDSDDCSLFNLGLKAINGHRPNIPSIPLTGSEEKYVELMFRCWDQNQHARPSFQEIYVKMENNVLSLLD